MNRQQFNQHPHLWRGYFYLPPNNLLGQFREGNVIWNWRITDRLSLLGFYLIQHCPYPAHFFFSMDTLIPFIESVETMETVEWVETYFFVSPTPIPKDLLRADSIPRSPHFACCLHQPTCKPFRAFSSLRHSFAPSPSVHSQGWRPIHSGVSSHCCGP